MRTTIEDPKAPTLTFKLPRGVVLKKEDESLTILNEATVREMSGFEEDIIANTSMSYTERMHSLVSNCLVSLTDGNGATINSRKKIEKIPDQLLMSDLLVSVLRIREATVGSEIRQKVRCPECTTDDGRPFTWTAILNLSDFQGLPVEGDPLIEEREFTTSRGTKVVWKLMTGEMEKRVSKVQNKSKASTMALLSRLVSVNDQPADSKVLQRMPSPERQEIRRQFDQEGGIETDFDAVCGNCGHGFKVGLEVGGSDFFFPSETSED